MVPEVSVYLTCNIRRQNYFITSDKTKSWLLITVTCDTSKGYRNITQLVNLRMQNANSRFVSNLTYKNRKMSSLYSSRVAWTELLLVQKQRFKFSRVSILFSLFTYLLTYLLTPWSRVFLEKLTGFQLVKKFPAFYGTRIHKRTSTVPILNQLGPVHTSTTYFLKIHLNIILLSTPGSPKPSLSLRFPHQSPVYAFLLPHKRYISRPSHSSRFYHPKNIG